MNPVVAVDVLVAGDVEIVEIAQTAETVEIVQNVASVASVESEENSVVDEVADAASEVNIAVGVAAVAAKVQRLLSMMRRRSPAWARNELARCRIQPASSTHTLSPLNNPHYPLRTRKRPDFVLVKGTHSLTRTSNCPDLF